MKRTIIASAVIASALVSGYASALTVKGGTVDFEGSVTNGTCAVDSRTQTVELGEVRAANFKAVGDSSARKDFKISLIDCDASITTSTAPGATATAAISFVGTQDNGPLDNILALTGPGSATGLGIGIQDTDAKTQVTLDNKPGSAKPLNNGQNDIWFNAQYIATDSVVTAGKANATVSFSVTYE